MKIKKNKPPKIQFACANDEFRPLYGYILVTKEDIVATDSHILVIHKTENIFDKKFIDEIPDRFLIHNKLWAILSKGFYTISFDNKKQCILINDGQIDILLNIEFEDKIGNFPNYKSLIDEHKNNKLNKIGMSYSNVYNIGRALGSNYLQFNFNEDKKAIIVKSENAIGIIMPCIIDFDK